MSQLPSGTPGSGSSGDAPRRGLFSLYKPGQGYWTRMLSGIGAGTVVLAGVAWAWAHMARIRENTVYWQSGMAVAVIAIFGALIFYLLNKPRIADFMIATEAEMKKVNWPSRREIIGATIVVILGTAIIALMLFAIDIGFGWLFIELGVLEGGSTEAAL